MTEQDWLACTDPTPMLDFLQDKASERKLRLFACAWCRCVWVSLTEKPFRDAVEVAERFADGSASKNDLAAARKTSGAALERCGLAGVAGPAYSALGCAWSTTRMPVMSAAMYPTWVFNQEAEKQQQASMLRDLVGNPFDSVPVDPSWLTPAVVKLAQSIYDKRAFNRLLLLADALEEAGCADTDILGHCRQPGPHVRGCWVVDMLLGKE